MFGQARCASVAVDYYSDFLGKDTHRDSCDLSNIDCPILDNDLANALVAPVTPQIILATLKSVTKHKALGPDGLNVEFFLKTWHIVGHDFCEAVLDFSSTQKCTLGSI